MAQNKSGLPYTKSEAKAWAKETIVDWYDCPTTPFLADDSLDEDGLRKNVEYYMDIGETGLVCGGFVAECWNTTVTEWMRYHEVIAEVAGGKIPLHTIIFDPSVHQAMEKLNYVESLGFEAAEVVTPIVQLRADDEIFDYFNYLADNSNLALLFYRSAVSGHLISLELSQRLSEIETMVGMKQGSLNHADSLKLRKLCRDDFIVSDPIETHWFNDLRGGGQVLYGAFHHILYGKKRVLLEEYTALARAGKWDEAYVIWDSLSPVRDLLDEIMLGPLSGSFTYATTLGNVKAWYEAMGLAAGKLRSPMRQVAPEYKEWIAGRLKELGVV